MFTTAVGTYHLHTDMIMAVTQGYSVLFLIHFHVIKALLYSFIPSIDMCRMLDSLPFSGASSILLCYIPFPSTLSHQLALHPPSFHIAIYLLVYHSALLFPDSYIILCWKFYFFPVSLHAQTNVIYIMLLSL